MKNDTVHTERWIRQSILGNKYLQCCNRFRMSLIGSSEMKIIPEWVKFPESRHVTSSGPQGRLLKLPMTSSENLIQFY